MKNKIIKNYLTFILPALAILITALIYYSTERKAYLILDYGYNFTKSQTDSININIVKANFIYEQDSSKLILINENIYWKNDSLVYYDRQIDNDVEVFKNESSKNYDRHQLIRNLKIKISGREALANQYAFEVNLLDTTHLFKKLSDNRNKNKELELNFDRLSKISNDKVSNCK